MKADDLLELAGAAVRDRRQSYGGPAHLFAQIARRWSLVLGVPVTPAQAVLCMLEIKHARLTHQPRHRDSIIDLAGYSALLWEIMHDG
jgi:hypothetical protein